MSWTIETASWSACGGPAIVTRVGSHDWSIWIIAPVYCWSALIVSPPLPITRPTIDLGQSTTAVCLPGASAASAAAPAGGAAGAP